MVRVLLAGCYNDPSRACESTGPGAMDLVAVACQEFETKKQEEPVEAQTFKVVACEDL